MSNSCKAVSLIAACVLVWGCSQPEGTSESNQEDIEMTERDPFADAHDVAAPVIEKRPVETTQHGVTRVDNYAWLRDEEWQEVLRDPSTLDADIRAAVEAENEYYKKLTDDLEPLRKKLFSEMRGRIKEDDSTVPAKDGEWKYWVKYREGGEYPIFVRAPAGGGDETLLFDGDKEGEGAEFFNIGDIAHSPDHRLIATAIDRLGSEYFSIRVRNVETGEEYDETIESADGSGAVWNASSSAFYYVERDDNQRPKRVKLHILGSDPADDRLIYEEADDGFFLDIAKSQSGEYIFIQSSSHTASEVRFMSSDDLDATPTLIEARADHVEYSVEHHGDDFYILTNADDAVDFKIVRAPVATPGRENWSDWLAHEAGAYVIDFTPYKNYLVRLERRDALPRIVVSTYDGAEHVVDFDEAAYHLGLRSGYEYDTEIVRYVYESPSTPEQTYDYNMNAHTRTLLKTQEVPSGHNASLYAVERINAGAADGALVPMTILRLKSTPKDGSAPALLYGYGSYGYAYPASFSTSILPLVDRGFVYAIAHIRGGSSKGRQWYLDGKRDKKMNSFTDFTAAADSLIAGGYTSEKKNCHLWRQRWRSACWRRS